MHVLLTGASGFVGSALCDELTRRGIAVSALMRKSSSSLHLRNAQFTPITGDLRESQSLEDAVRDVDVILHVAGVVTARSKQEFFLHNSDGTANLARAAKQFAKNLKRFVYVSSLAAGGPSQPAKPRLETDAPEPVSFYGESKLGGEKALAELDLPHVIVRPPAVYGPRDRGMFSFFQMVNAGITLRIGRDRSKRYSFIHVEDLVQGILAAAFVPELQTGEIFYLSEESNYTWDESMGFIADALGKNTVRLTVPEFALKSVGGIYSVISLFTGRALPLSLDKVKELTAPSWTCSNHKAVKALGFAPKWQLSEGFAHTARWYKDHGWL